MVRPDANLHDVSGRGARLVAVHDERGAVYQPQRLGVADRPRPVGRIRVGVDKERMVWAVHSVILEELGHGERAVERVQVERRTVPALGCGDVWVEDERAGGHTGVVKWSGQPVDRSYRLTYLSKSPPTSDDAS